MNLVRAKILFALFAFALTASAQTKAVAPPHYNIYEGNTHSHTQYTWSHGEQWDRQGCSGILVYGPVKDQPFVYSWTTGYVAGKGKCPAIYTIDGLQYPAPGVKLKPDWEKVQGPPSRHYQLAKQAGFDFYTTSDHSQEAAFWPNGPSNPAWMATKEQAKAATDKDFVAIPGFEFSENDGPGGKGHINVLNSDSILDALAPGVDLPSLYKWLKAAKPNGSGPVVASFNHPGPRQYNNWDYRDPAVTNIITMLEVINSNTHIHYEAFINALDNGWKVSPVSGMDNHGLTGISKDTSRTFVLATAKTKLAILDAMKHRRTYASLDKDIQCQYSVNGQIMGSTLNSPSVFKFDIRISDPDNENPKDKITKIDIVKDHGEVAQSYTPDRPGYAVTWTPTLKNGNSKYFTVRVWNAGGGDAPGADSSKPVAWLAPIWTGR